MKLVMFGLFGCGNLGNDGSLEAVVTRLWQRIPESEITAVCYDMGVVRKRLDIPTVPLARSRYLAPALAKLDKLFLRLPSRMADFVAAFLLLRKSDAMIVPGTGILDDFGERPYGMPFVILLWTLAARLAGTKIAFVSIGAGPIRSKSSRFLMLQSARLAHYRSYRDTISKDFMTRAGIDTSKDGLFPDVAFGLPAPAPACYVENTDGRMSVGLGVMNYGGWYRDDPAGRAIFDRYIANLTEFAVWLLDRGYDVRLLTGELNDQVAIDDVLRGLREQRPDDVRERVVAEPSYSLGDVMEQISRTDIAVVSRFHNVVCAIKMAVPVMSLGYAAKNEALLEQVGLGGLSQHMESFDVERLKSQFESFAARRSENAAVLRTRAAEFLEQLGEQDAMLLRTLDILPASVRRADPAEREAFLSHGR